MQEKPRLDRGFSWAGEPGRAGQPGKRGEIHHMSYMKPRGAVIAGVEPGSPADRAGMRPGEILREIDNEPVLDLIDYLYLSAAEQTVWSVEDAGKIRRLRLVKGYDQNPGLEFDGAVFDRVKTCRNRCLFCFLKGMPPGLRPNLYLRDDDYRLSFLHGNFITLTNMEEADLDRIVRWKLSPLYVSVQSTDPDLRRRLLGTRGPADILVPLDRLLAVGIQVHAQVVLCPDLNDGEHLERTVEDLSRRQPGVASLAVVPAGFTRHHPAPLRPFTKDEARRLLTWAGERQKGFRRAGGVRFLYPADEFYLLAGRPLPGPRSYDDFPQLENGVGLGTHFAAAFRRRLRHQAGVAAGVQRRVAVLTGRSGRWVLEPLVEELQKREPRLAVRVLPVANRFFGERVTVSGLLVGSDLAEAIGSLPDDEEILLPASTLRDDAFLDGMTLRQLGAGRSGTVRAVPPNGEALYDALVAGWPDGGTCFPR